MSWPTCMMCRRLAETAGDDHETWAVLLMKDRPQGWVCAALECVLKALQTKEPVE